MRVRTVMGVIVVASAFCASPVAGQQMGAPESFDATLQVTGAQGGAGAASITIEVTSYTPDAERVAVETALKTGGYQAFLSSLKDAPAVGAVRFRDRSWTIRWARQVKTGPWRRTLTLVTDSPIYFVGGGLADAKPRTGYDVALLRLEIDDVGIGWGTMAGAARVRAGQDAGVDVDDYNDTPIKLTNVRRRAK